MQKIKLIDVKEMEVYEGSTSVKFRVPMKHHTEIFPIGEFKLQPLMEEYHEVPIQLFEYVDSIGVHTQRAEKINLNNLINDGYHINQERMSYEKTINYLIAVTPEASKFIGMEGQVIDELKSQIKNLSNSLSLSINTSSSLRKQIKQLQDENDKRWIVRGKQCLSNLCEWLSNIIRT